jgi:hypothetical protein
VSFEGRRHKLWNKTVDDSGVYSSLINPVDTIQGVADVIIIATVSGMYQTTLIGHTDVEITMYLFQFLLYVFRQQMSILSAAFRPRGGTHISIELVPSLVQFNFNIRFSAINIAPMQDYNPGSKVFYDLDSSTSYPIVAGTIHADVDGTLTQGLLQ